MKENPLGIFRFSKVIVPILIGLGAGFFMIQREYSRNSAIFFDLASLCNTYTLFCLFLAFLFECGRELTYMMRIRILSDKKLSWKQSFQIIMLWEFSSTVTPTSVGGSAVALFIIPLECIGVGRSTAIVMFATLMDELFYIIISPIIIFIVGLDISFATKFKFTLLGLNISEMNVFIIGYSFMMLLTLAILLAICFYPKKFRNWLYKLSNKKFFKHWQKNLQKTGDDVLNSSEEYKHKSFIYWLKVYIITVASWSCRFLVLNCILAAFDTNTTNHLVIYVRQLVMWIVLCISPTPGSSGIAEFAFPLFLNGLLPQGFESILALLWRLFTYYPYIIIGIIILPIFTRRVTKRRKQLKKRNY